MNRIITKLFFLSYLLIPALNFGQQDFAQLQPNAQAVGIGGSNVALPYDPSACYWNPASIAFLSTNRVLLNINDESYLNYIGLTKFFPPSITLGISVFRSMSNNHHYDMATIATGFRLVPFCSIGTNLNFSKTVQDEIYSSVGLGLFFKSLADYQASYSYNTLWSWLRSKQMSEKFSFGISLHNISLNEKQKKQELRIGTAIKPHNLGPLIHFAYHLTPNDHSLHLGTITSLSKHFDLIFGVKDLNINTFTVGGAIELGPFEVDMSYDFKYTKIYFSFMLRLSEGKNALFQKYKQIGDQQIKENNLSSALHSYQKALAYNPDNKDLNYLISVLHKESDQTSQRIDSLFTSGESFEKKGWYINTYITYQKILEIDPNNRRARNRLKALNSKLKPYLDQIFSQALTYYYEPDLKRAKIIFDSILLVNKNHQGAKTYLAKIDSINSNKANEHFYRGVGYYNQRNLNRAEQEFKDALIFNPDYSQSKEYLEKIDKEIKNNNRMINQYLKEAKNYEQEEKYVRASISYRKILEIDKTHQYAKNRLTYLDSYILKEVEDKFKRARLLYDNLDYSGAITILKEILIVDPDHNPSRNYLRRANEKLFDLAEQHYLRAQNFFNQKKWDIVFQECNLTLLMNPDHLRAKELQQMALANISIDKLLDKSIEYYERGDLLNARPVFRQVLAKEPNNTTAQDYLNKLETELGDRVKELFNIALEKYTEGDYEEAINELKKILGIDPEHKSAKDYIQKAQERIDALKRIE